MMRNGRNCGKGYSVRRGALAAKGGWVLMSDVDESAPLTEFAALAPFADRAIACGSRRCGGDVRPFLRCVLSRLFNALTDGRTMYLNSNVMTKSQIADTIAWLENQLNDPALRAELDEEDLASIPESIAELKDDRRDAARGRR